MSRALLWILLSSGVASSAFAQTLIREFSGPSSGYGRSVAFIGDIDQDAVADLLIADQTAGIVEVRSGRTGEWIREHRGEDVLDVDFGTSLFELDDLTGDGVSDYAIRAGGRISQFATLTVFDGASGVALTRFVSQDRYDGLGADVACGDIDQDGVSDLWLGIPGGEVWPLFRPGMVVAISSNGWHELFSVVGYENGGTFGHSLTTLDDLDGDGVAEVAITETGVPKNGLRIVSGSTGAPIYRIHSEGSPPVGFSGKVRAIPDVDGDGLRDLLVGSPSDRTPSGQDNGGSVRVYSGRDGQLLATRFGLPSQGLGTGLGWIEANGDPIPELLIGSSILKTVDAYTPDLVERVFRLELTPNQLTNFASGRDLDGDARADFFVPGQGVAQLYSGVCSDIESRGEGCPGTGGITPFLSLSGCTYPGEDIRVTIRRARGLSFGSLLIGPSIPEREILGCEILVDPLFTVPFLTFGPAGQPGVGEATIPLHIPPGDQFIGLSVGVQAAILDVGAPTGLAATSSFKVTIL